MNKQLIAGYGFVGKSIAQLFPEADVYDIKFARRNNPNLKERYDICHICVPTPQNEDGSCDTTQVSLIAHQVNAFLYIIHSTVNPKFTEQIQRVYTKSTTPYGVNPEKFIVSKLFVFCPEYVASSSPYPAPLRNIKDMPFVILGGIDLATKKARELYETVYPPTTQIMETDSTSAELIKLFENTAIACKVTLCNEFKQISEKFKCDWSTIRRGVFGLDPRFTEWWTYVSKGWGGHCLPKDVSNLIVSAQKAGANPAFIEAIVSNNERHKR
jgi:UDPglucose 6-dehydrogenase